MASAAAAGVAVKFWTPNLGARVPTDLNTGIPDYREYLESGLWCQRRMLRSVSGTGVVTYQPRPQDARVWPESLPTAVLQVYDSQRQMLGAGQERFCGSDVALHCLEGQVSLIHHVLAFEEANGGRKILSDTQRWKAQFAAYFLGAVSQAQLSLLEQTTNNTAGVAYASPNSWVVKTSKKLSYELRHNSNRNLGRLSDAQFEHLPMLQAFQWAPVKILAFLLSNSKSRFAIHLQLRELMYERIEHWDIYISLSAFQGHTRYSDVASEESFGKKLSLTDLMGHGKVFHCTKNHNWDSISASGLLLSATRGAQTRSRQAIHFVYAGGEVGPQAGTVVLYGRDVFYCQLDYWQFYHDGHELYLTPNGVILSYVDVPAKYLYFMRRPPHEEDVGAKRWNKRQQQSREERGSMDPESSSDPAAGRGSVDPAPGAASSSDPGRGSMDPGPGKARKGQQAKGGREGVPSEPPQPESADAENLRKSIDEAERQQSRRRLEANETVEVDIRVNTAKVHMEQQEALLRQTNSNPWFLFNQGVLALKDAKGNKIYSDYGDARARVVAWRDMPVRLRALFGDVGPARWLQHPFSGYSVHFFLRAFELGKMEGNFLMEFKKEKLYTRKNSAGVPVHGYRSVFGDIANCLNYTNHLCSQEFDLQASLQFREPDSNDPAAFPPKPDDPDFAEKMTAHEQHKKFSEAWRECGLVKTDFSMVVAAVSSLLGEDLLSYLRTRQEDIQLRSKYLYRFDDGQVAYDCSLGERFSGPMIPLVIKKIITMWDSLPASERGFKSEFAKKAWADLLAYEEIKAADEANLSDLLERPYEDLVTEEIIDSLPGPEIEPVEPDDDPDKVKVEGVSMDTESAEPTPMEVEGGSVDPVSTKEEAKEDVEMDDSHVQSAPFKKPRTSADPPTTEVKEESGSVDPESFVGLGEDQNVFDNLPKISEEEVQEAMRKQGVWGKQSTYVDPKDIDMARTFSSAPDASRASEINDEFVATSKKGEEQLDIRSLEEFKTFIHEDTGGPVGEGPLCLS